MKTIAQNLIILTTKPYISRELPGWGLVYKLFVGGFEKNWLWEGAPTRTIRSKINGFRMRFDLSKWSDRLCFFLGRWYSLEMQLLMQDLVKPDDTVIDIGANHGMFTLAAVKAVGPRGRVIAFEPNPVCFKTMTDNLELNGIKNVVAHQCGLADKEAALTLTVPKVNDGQGTLVPWDRNLPFDTHQVQVEVGDNILRDVSPRLIKIDTEGFEVNVLRGLSNTIERSHPYIITEVGEDLVKAGASFSELCSLMEDKGYVGGRLIEVKRGGKWYWHLDPLPKESAAKNFDVLWAYGSLPSC